ncbi:helix-turn-helix transcriptional regulator [Subsaximicrobium wynnwilliamsii]|uniref:Helix-turn-helix transcriptional regulator n=1 Tax=Subsaximicrobium wynnwilliamsii TaxID=291179 RepID=A0A5C6ZP99_9FLAO|nr:AraC family transcriptional regulator [Subsaximicrobium wynnwilliamsii]TXD85204.1 helix-turn-helix transcriptional regulator [Subsaximicrobium wynnwilliamsii]TXD91247.1 helix-turn-helix transcriptional regulator [Subsaximicrobium wynnwilliamsii]TXE04640.1 helix-turn-helix transcriptional regulator [Subsaximicrobium wynnwilliamsii]
MINIRIKEKTLKNSILAIQKQLGGELSEKWGEYVLEVDNDIAKGCMRFFNFNWGVSLVEINIIFFEEVTIATDISLVKPIHFLYCLNGSTKHRFKNEESFKELEQYHTAILAGCDASIEHVSLFPKGLHIELCSIQIKRLRFLKKRNNNVDYLSDKLNALFVNNNKEDNFSYYGSIDLKMADHVERLQNIDSEGIIRTLQMEGEVQQILSLFIEQHNNSENNIKNLVNLSKKELQTIRRQVEKIVEEPSKNYSLSSISRISGLSQAKLQEGFKFLYGKTVTEYIRHVRLEEARELISTSDLNISEIVYSIGFTSRSYFSKIFKEKYDVTPNDFRKEVHTLNIEKNE